ncbi:GT2 family glycosyltransferase [Pectinatus brassicae]|uniref:GT2 family glycosyltransferase n=1 Tax=Pectinatus brassicae TaxID=862415 RepID=A0A840UIE9_9FIRM|nr:glycosyltransferase [Pectinatus brassicae]MBB5336886.1 GT2 family glycosyltransferase [Pectinatus brassicae]
MLKYVKFSDERKQNYKIETSIWQEEKNTFIKKTALNNDAKKHIKAIYENYKILSKIYGKNHIAACDIINDYTIKIEYVEGMSLADKIVEVLDSNNFNKFDKLMKFYEADILHGEILDNKEFFLRNASEESRNTNIDLSFDNIILTNNSYKIIDYEWLYTNIPKKFVLYRALEGFIERKEKFKKVLYQTKIYKKNFFDIPPKYIEKEREFYDEVLQFPNKKYEKTIVNFFDDIDQKRKQEEKKYHILENEYNILENEYNILENEYNILENEYNILENEYNKIIESRGYRVLLKYYKVRDKFLPVNSTRRLCIKFILKILNKKTYQVINYNNIKKSIKILRYGGLHQFLVKLDSKMNADAIKEVTGELEKKYLNNNITSEPVELPAGTVVDIVIPIYNAFEYLKKCLETVYNNTTVNYNLYLVNDCSTDHNIEKFLLELKQKEYPVFLQKLTIMNNEENKGFIESVNSALKIAENNTVLLNTDTEVTPNWLQRLYLPILRDNKIASITPFSNSATICSYPHFCEDNELPDNWSVEKLDKLFEEYGGTKVFDIPTGVGFCMLLNRKCITEIGVLDTVYGKGYCEENDWCMRAMQKGYHNVMVTNLFVYHKHGVSFGEHHDKGKEQRIQENLAVLNERYPEYTRLVDTYIARDPVKYIREFVEYIQQEKEKSSMQGVLFVNHSSGGGTKVYQDNLIDKWKTTKRIHVMELLPDCKTLLWKVYNDGNEKQFYFDLKLMKPNEFKKLINAFSINLIYINQLVTYPIEKIIEFIKAAECEYIFFLHDFYAVCPEYTLLNEKKLYCNNEKQEKCCNECLRALHNDVSKDIGKWRSVFHEFLLGAKEVLAPSNSTAQIVNSYYGDVKITVKEHEVPSYVHQTFNADVLEDEILTITVLGAIGENKGSNIIYELEELIRKNKLPINIKVIGITNLHNKPYKSKDGILEITGPYDNTNVSDLLAKYRTAVVLIPSIWPETYSYTASEALYSGYPIISFNIGAPAERIKKMNSGWVIDKNSTEECLNLLIKLSNDRNEILLKHSAIVKNGSEK